MSSELLVLVVHFHAKPDRVDELRERLLALLPDVQQEDGCISYHLHVDDEDPLHFVFTEEWENRDQWRDEHLNQPYILKINEDAPDMVSEAPSLYCLTRLG